MSCRLALLLLLLTAAALPTLSAGKMAAQAPSGARAVEMWTAMAPRWLQCARPDPSPAAAGRALHQATTTSASTWWSTLWSRLASTAPAASNVTPLPSSALSFQSISTLTTSRTTPSQPATTQLAATQPATTQPAATQPASSYSTTRCPDAQAALNKVASLSLKASCPLKPAPPPPHTHTP